MGCVHFEISCSLQSYEYHKPLWKKWKKNSFKGLELRTGYVLTVLNSASPRSF